MCREQLAIKENRIRRMLELDLTLGTLRIVQPKARRISLFFDCDFDHKDVLIRLARKTIG